MSYIPQSKHLQHLYISHYSQVLQLAVWSTIAANDSHISTETKSTLIAIVRVHQAKWSDIRQNITI